MAAGTLHVLSRAEQASVLLEPTRRRLVQQLGEPGSAASLARKLGLPRQRVNYHLRELEKQGLLELVEERRRGNCVERVVRATARHYLISSEALGALGATPEERQDRASAQYLMALAAGVVRDVARLEAGARKAGKRLATLSLETEVRFRRAEDRQAFAEELAFALGRLAAKYHDAHAPDGRSFRFMIGGHPALRRTSAQAAEEVP